MDLRQLSPSLAVSGQIMPQDVPDLAAAGFRVLVINRPDDEVDAALDHTVMEQAARNAGMTCHYLPFHPGQITLDLMTEFNAVTAGRQPVIAYCRSGHRCTVLWALSQADKRSEAEILEVAEDAGYDIAPVLPLIRSLSGKKT